jgi:hypothetical protein
MGHARQNLTWRAASTCCDLHHVPQWAPDEQTGCRAGQLAFRKLC